MITRLRLTKKVLIIILKLLFVLLFVASSYYLLREIPTKPKAWIYYDKVQHATLFFTLTLIGLFLFRVQQFILVFLLLCYGGVTEYLQSTMTTTRTGSVEDWLADLAGVCLGCVMVWLIAYMINRRQKQDVQKHSE